MTHDPATTPRGLRLLFAAFVLSGFSGLIYQSIWSHYLRLFLGHAAHGQTVVLVVFVGGMALGSLLVGQRSARLRRPLLGYAAVEAAIGAAALVFHDTYEAVTDWALAEVMPALCSADGPCGWQWLVAALLILPQSILLGATFPLMAAGVLRRYPGLPGGRLALLYFLNSAGAVVGVLCSGFLLIPALGLPGTQLVAGLGNFIVAALVYVVARGEAGGALALEAADDVQPRAARLGGEPTALLWIAALTGLSSFVYEIAWVRMLSMVLGASTQAFEVMLAAFILGLALGGLLVARRIDRLRETLRLLAVVQLAMGGLAALTIAVGNAAFDWNHAIVEALGRSEAGASAYALTSTLIAIATMLPATLCAGMTLPLITYRLLRLQVGERAIGRVYGVNTLGGIVGVLLAVHLLLPRLGVDGALLLAAGVDIGLGALLLLGFVAATPRLRVIAALAVLALAYGVFGLRLDPKRAASGVFGGFGARLPPGVEVAFARDGTAATIHVMVTPGLGAAISTNGKSDGAIQTGPGPAALDEATMALTGALPLLVRPRAKSMALIGWGTGMSTAVATGSPHLERIDTIEIEPAMVEGARAFRAVTAAAYDDPRSHLILDDAKSTFARARRRYDLIVAEPSNPWVSGVATLFSREFYARLHGYLSDDGVLVQWVQTYDCSVEVVASILAALQERFPRFALYEAQSSDLLIVAPRDPNADLRLAADAIATAGLGRWLRRVGVHDIEDVRQRWLGDQRSHGGLAAALGVPANSDYAPYVELEAPRARWRKASAAGLGAFASAPVPAAELLCGQLPPPPHARLDVRSPSLRVAERARAQRLLAAVLPPDAATATATTATAAQSLDAAVPAEAADAALIGRLALIGCAGGAGLEEATLLRAATTLARTINPFVRRDTAMALWRAIGAAPCHGARSPRLQGWLSLYAAVAARDVVAMERLGRALLRADREAPRERVEVALAAAMLADALRGDRAAAGALHDATAKRIGVEAALSPLWIALRSWR